jgi:hypothetical protein
MGLVFATTTARAFAVLLVQQGAVESSASSPVTFSTLLRDFRDPMRPAREDVGAWTTWLATSRNPKAADPTDPAWFANDDRDHFLRVESIDGRDAWVLCDIEGPGAITRVWTATEAALVTATIRIYLDGAKEPLVEAPFYDWLRGRSDVPSPIASMLAPGGLGADVPMGSAAVSLMPIPFAKRCVVTLDRKPGYWQISGRSYRAGTVVESLTRETLAAERAQLARIAQELMRPSVVPPQIASTTTTSSTTTSSTTKTSTTKTSTSAPLISGDTRSTVLTRAEPIVWERDGSGVIERIRVDIQEAPRDRESLAELLRSVWLECDFEDEVCVRAPIGHFFGLGECLPPVGDRMRTALRRADGVLSLECRFAMPFTTRAKVVLSHRGSSDATLAQTRFALEVNARTPNANDRTSPRLFHAMFREVRDVSNRRIHDLTIALIEGEGEWIGTTLAVLSPHAFWFGEGDEKVFVDGDLKQSQLGTGTEDFIGCAWGFPRALSSDAVSVAPRDSMHRTSYEGRTTASRLRFLDGVAFAKHIEIKLEWVPPASFDRRTVLAATTFWYAAKGRSRAIEFDDPSTILANPPPDSMRPIKGAIEAESCAVIGRSEQTEFDFQDIGALFPDAVWSAGRSLFVQPHAIGDWIRVEVPCEDFPDGTMVRVVVRAIGAPDYGWVRFRVVGSESDSTAVGRVVGPVVDLRRSTVEPVPEIDLGVHQVRRGRCVVEIEAVKPEGAKSGDVVPTRAGIFFGIDAFFITPVAK